MIGWLAALSRGLNRLAAGVAILLILYMFGHIILEIVLRLFGHSTFILDEYIGYAVAAMTFLGLPYVLEKNGLIRVALVLDRLPKKWHWPLELLIAITSFGAFAWLSLFWWKNVVRSYQRGITSDTLAETPLWIPEGIVLLGLWLLCFTLVVRSFQLVTERSRHTHPTQ
ncbi:TRAP transporter small permease [Halomonas salifodinae]|uniref:TRAP transporter small permease protein n=1 Tax=Halomonas salifodinae TaxID=438745 RepID=A0ABW2EUK1_9GAMM